MERIIFAVCNQQEPVKGPYLNVCDFRLEYRIDFGNGMYGVVSDKVFDTIGMTKLQLEMTAVENLKPVIMPMSEFFGLSPRKDDLIIVTNKEKYNGFAALLYHGTLRKLKDKYGDYRILPSSKHEALIVPESININVKELRQMVHNINLTAVDEEDRLSDNVYKYDGGKIVVA